MEPLAVAMSGASMLKKKGSKKGDYCFLRDRSIKWNSGTGCWIIPGDESSNHAG
jgi:hypothetical protein